MGATDWGQAMDMLVTKIERTTRAVVAWIKEHPKLTKMIGEFLVGIAVIGPMTRFIANIGLIGSGVLSGGR